LQRFRVKRCGQAADRQRQQKHGQAAAEKGLSGGAAAVGRRWISVRGQGNVIRIT
jgi:hypothetical protein